MKLMKMSILYVGLNGIKQLVSQSLYKIDSTAYNKPYRKFLKKLLGYNGKMDEHHIIPRSLKQHPVLYDVELNSGKNLKLMPNIRTKEIPKNVLVHESHVLYTRYVKKQLDSIDPYGPNREYELWLLLGHLEQNLNFKDQIPFRESIKERKYINIDSDSDSTHSDSDSNTDININNHTNYII
jgi:hypothetical protein